MGVALSSDGTILFATAPTGVWAFDIAGTSWLASGSAVWTVPNANVELRGIALAPTGPAAPTLSAGGALEALAPGWPTMGSNAARTGLMRGGAGPGVSAQLGFSAALAAAPNAASPCISGSRDVIFMIAGTTLGAFSTSDGTALGSVTLPGTATGGCTIGADGGI
jgi:hypothetical protein